MVKHIHVYHVILSLTSAIEQQEVIQCMTTLYLIKWSHALNYVLLF